MSLDPPAIRKIDVSPSAPKIKSDLASKVLAVSEFKLNNWPTNENEIKGSFMPVIWKKNYGKGRVFYSSIGHYLREFEIPEVLTMQMRGFRLASEGKYHLKENLISPVYKK